MDSLTRSATTTAELTAMHFADAVGEMTVFAAQNQHVVLTLEQVTELPAYQVPGRARVPFRLLFSGPKALALSQANYVIQHPELGLLEPLFFVPTQPPVAEGGANAPRLWYAVDFS